jgi:hypothetical protein
VLRTREESERSLLSLILPRYADMAMGGHSDADEQLLTEYESYLSSLSSATFQQLMKEPEKLHDESEKMKKQMQDLAFTNYKAFIQTSECIRGMKQQVCRVCRVCRVVSCRVVCRVSCVVLTGVGGRAGGGGAHAGRRTGDGPAQPEQGLRAVL